MKKVLVVYATRHGTTAGIARRIGEVLRTEGLDVVVADAAMRPDPIGFDAYVIGSAAYIGSWEKAATEFVKRHQAVLAARPCWLFSSGPVGTDRIDKKGQSVLVNPKTVTEFEPILKPRGTEVFFGAWDPSAPFASLGERIVRNLPAVKDLLPIGDFREWPVIEAWARQIATQLNEIREPIAVG
jgi:menaquinone-dependent protoporphyrinogen oxidase